MDSFTLLTRKHSTWKPNQHIRGLIRDYFLFQHITEPTRFREGQNPTLDDLIFTNESEMLEQLKYLAPPGGSDHIALEFNFINRTVLLYDKGDYEKMKQLFNRDWTQVLQSMNPQDVFDTLEKSLHQATELCIPSKVITDVGRFKPLWMNKQAPRKARKNIMRGYDTSTPRVESITRTIFEHVINPAMSPEEPERTLK